MDKRALLSNLLPQAEARLLRTHRSLNDFELALAATFLPPLYWSRRICRLLNFLELSYGRAQRHFDRLVSALVAPSKLAAKSESDVLGEQTKITSPLATKYGQRHHQSAEVKLVDGIAVTAIVDYPNSHWLNRPPFLENSIFCRQVSFVSRVIPEPYAQILHRRGIILDPPPRGLFLYYSQQEFLQLCRQEIESGAAHFTEGNPYYVRPLI